MLLPRRALVGITAALTASACSASTPPHATTTPAAPSAGRHLVVTRDVVTAGRTPWQLSAPVSRLVALADDTGVLLAGGLNASNISLDGIYHLDPKSGSLRQIGTLAQPVHDAAGASLAGSAVFFGGGAGSTTAAVQRFDRNGTARVIGHLPQPRSDLSAVTGNGQVFLLGGYTGSNPLGSVLATTNGTTFHTIATLPVTVRYAAVTVVGTTIWVFGGEHGSRPIRDIQRIDTNTGQAQVVGQLPTPLSDAAAMVVNGHILIAGGRTSSTHATGTVYAFDPARNSAKLVAHLIVPVADAGSVVVNNIGYLLGGESSTQVAIVQTLSVHAVPINAGTGSRS